MNNTRGDTGGSNLVADVYKCCNCLKVPEGQIFHCKNAHMICVNCSNKDTKCGKCNEALPTENKTRNEQLEEILDGIEFNCEFSGKGCKEKLIRQMLSRHFRTCSYRETTGDQRSNAMTSGSDGPSTSQNAVGTSVGVKQEVEKNSVPVIVISEDDDDCQIIDEEEHPSSRIKQEALISSGEAMELELDVDNPCENSTINVSKTPFSSACGLKIKSVAESNTASETTEVIFLSEDEDEVEDTSCKIKNNDTSENPTTCEIPSSSTNQVNQQVEANSVQNEGHPAPPKTTEALTSSDDAFAIQHEVKNPSEDSSLNVATPSSSTFTLKRQHQEITFTYVEESHTALGTTDVITLSGDEEEVEDTPGDIRIDDNSTTNNRVSRKRKLEYKETEENNKADRTEEILNIFALSSNQISRMIRETELMEHYYKCKISFSDSKSPRSKIPKVKKLLSKCGSQFEELDLDMPYSERNLRFSKKVFQAVANIKSLSYQYQNSRDALKFLTTLKVHKDKGNFPALSSFKLVGTSGEESLTNEHIIKLSEVGIRFQTLELGDALWEDVTPATIRNLMEKCKSSLETLIIHGGFRGSKDKTVKTLTFPRMENLSTLYICPQYEFFSKVQNSLSNKGTVSYNCENEAEEPIKVNLKFETSFPNLKDLLLSYLVEVENLYFSTVRKLSMFRCGSYWNLSVQFPRFPKTSLNSNVTHIQFPDALKDPSFPEKVLKYFPNLKTVCIYLPSVPVLQAFFKAFENSSLVSIYLKTQYDFASTLESCLFPGSCRVQINETNSILQTLKEYKHYNEYVSYYNLQLPAEQIENGSETSGPGILGLKNLKQLFLEHIPRTLLIPAKDENRKWDDVECKFSNTTFGFDDYPLSYECHEEILKMNLVEYDPIRMINTLTGELYQEIKNDELACEADVEFFIRCVWVNNYTQLKIMPSIPNKKIKPD